MEMESRGDSSRLIAVIVEFMDAVGGWERGNWLRPDWSCRFDARFPAFSGSETLPHVPETLDESRLLPVGSELAIFGSVWIALRNCDDSILREKSL